MKALVLYDSMGGNTRKAAEKIQAVGKSAGLDSTIVKLEDDTEIDFYDYDWVFLGSPVIEWLPTRKMMDFLKKKLRNYRISGDIPPSNVSVRPGKFAVCFGTHCGAHIGSDEALPMTDWMASFLGHIGYKVLDKIHLPGEMRDFGQGRDWMDDTVFEELNTHGRYGDIRGRPNDDDLTQLENRVSDVLASVAG